MAPASLRRRVQTEGYSPFHCIIDCANIYLIFGVFLFFKAQCKECRGSLLGVLAL